MCGCRPCISCFGTGNKNFPKGGQTTSRNSFPFPCSTCTGSGKETYFETKENPYFGKTEDKSLDSYKYRKEVEQICKNLSEAENLNPNVIKMYQEAIETYEKLGGANPLVTLAKQQLVRLRRTHTLLNFNNNLEKYKSEGKLFQGKLSVEKIDSYQKALNTLEKGSVSAIDIKTITKSRNILKEIKDNMMKKAMMSPVPEGTFTIKNGTFDHIQKPPLLRIRGTKWNEWGFESDNGGFIDTWGRQSENFSRAMAEQDKISWMRRFIVEYRKYAEYCKAQGVEPDPIPDVDVLNRRLEYVTLSDSTKIYNKNYNPPGCVLM